MILRDRASLAYRDATSGLAWGEVTTIDEYRAANTQPESCSPGGASDTAKTPGVELLAERFGGGRT